MDTDMHETHPAGSAGAASSSSIQHHMLRLHYPSVELLPPGKQPFIEIPVGVADRQEPELSRIGISAGDLDFFVRFQTNGMTDGGSVMLALGPQPLNLTACIDRLSACAGASDLYMVSYVEDWDVLTRFQLKTAFYTNEGKFIEPVQEFEYGSADIAKLIRTMRDKKWVRLFDDLLHAKSDRAYLYRYERLMQWHEDWTLDDEDRWHVSWDTNPILSANQLYADRLVSYTQSSEGSICQAKLGDLNDFRDKALSVILPCGHVSHLEPNEIQDMHPRDALTAICDGCEEPILSRGDLQLLKHYAERVRRYDWEDHIVDWVPKCKRVRNDSSLVEVRGGTLSASLLTALDTFELPLSMSPRSLRPNNYLESRALLNKLVDALRAHVQLPAMTPKALYTNLEKLAWQLIAEIVGDETMLRDVLPPGFDDFVSRWLTRAVNDAVGTQADEEQDADLMAAMDKMQRTKVDPTTAQTEADLDDILEQMDETHLKSSGDESINTQTGDSRAGAGADVDDEAL